MQNLFVFTELLSHNHTFIIVSQIVIVVFIILLIASFATKSMQLVPRGTQNVMEAILENIINAASSIVGEDVAKKYLPLAVTIGFFVLVSNMIGLIPGFESPTSDINVTLPLAIIVFLYYNFEGIRTNGVIKYFKHFMGPNIFIAPLMFPIEIISHFSRIISLAFRLFGNVKGDDIFLLVMLSLVPFFVPLLPYTLLLCFGIIQAFIFMILTYVYIGGAIQISEDH
ncbi:MAG: F0F1 ATP synthase subunit A [Campylobacteraceae bacterium]|jgi:F-type H+-transporting ATPase subunit a|nr:F0F1 ATP synthase subunit A [Campylobacteraceae bacterium]